ncbi:MAG: hypothetical protein JRJ43_12825, partial [Deltaproteobacteria bacterium]|nr:hypothetical protein [Deltaproteobacteria bacterium]
AHAGTGELKPVFKEYSRTGTGHPSGFTYGWTGHDDKNLHVKIDFTPDNTRDGNEDYAKVYVKTGDGLKEFKISEPETQWGSPDFTYTNKVVYQHKVYTFTIPFSEIGLDTLQNRKELSLAFAAYGTAAPGDYATGIAYDPFAKRHLAVFYSRPGGNTPDEIRGQFVNCDGTPTGPDFLVSTASFLRTDPSVAFDSVNRNFLVVWQDIRGGTDWDIYGQLVSSGGSLTGANFPISTALNSQNRPAIAFDGVNQRFLVAWMDDRNENTGDLYGQLVNTNGTLNGSDFGIAVVAGSNQFDPAVAFDNVNQRFLVAWADSRVSYLDLYGQRVNANGTLQGSYFVISAAADIQRVPSVAFDSLHQRFFVAWYDERNGPTGDLYGQLINTDGSLMGANIAVSTAADTQGWPSVSFNSSAQTFLVVWQDFRSGNFDIYGQYMTAVGALSGGDFLVSGGTGDQLTPKASYGSSASNFVVAFVTTATGAPDLAFALLGPACATASVPLPTAQEGPWEYGAVEHPEASPDPELSRPFAVGNLAGHPEASPDPELSRPFAVGNLAGGFLDLQAGFPAFSGPVDIYLGIYAPAISPDLYLLTPDNELQSVTQGLARWRTNTGEPVEESLFGEIPTSELPAGTYTLYCLVTLPGNLDNFYLWSTSFVLP